MHKFIDNNIVAFSLKNKFLSFLYHDSRYRRNRVL